jgi:hypothetical protein
MWPSCVLPVFLADVRHVAAAVDDTGPAGEILGVGEQRAPLRLQHIDDTQVLAPLLELSARGRQEVHVRVADHHPSEAMSATRPIRSVRSR